jgi:rfaE bifunctional protein kinase chain/domain
MGGLKVVVVGDVCLDEYLVGSPERLSREAPVPVLQMARRFTLPGGAANPALNVAALGGQAAQVGVVGDDAPGVALRSALLESGIDASGVIVDSGRPTTVKIRVIAEGGPAPQHAARIDHQSRQEVGEGVEGALVRALDGAAEVADAILISDYKSGVVTETIRDRARAAAARRGVWLTADSQGDIERYRGFGLVRATRRDVEASLGRRIEDEADYERTTTQLRRELGARVVIVSRGREGMSVADDDGYAVVRPANVSEVYDVAGAGDTVIAVLTLALAASASVSEAVAIANLAAGIVVRRLGVAAPTADEILAELD